MLASPVEFIHPKGRVSVVFQIITEGAAKVCGIYDLVGHISLPPKEWLSVVRDTMQRIERSARDAGCTEMRMAGRDWSRVFPDYEPLAGGDPNLIRKRL